MGHPKWKAFEKLACEIQRAVAPGATVTLDDRIMGADTRAPRQIDISIRQRVGQYDILIVVECKDHARPLDVEELGAFVTKVRDVRANKGAMVSANGYTPAAIELAKNYGLDTFRLVDAESSDWDSYISIPTLLCRTFLDRFALTFRGFDELPLISGSKPNIRDMIILDQNRNPIGTIGDLLIRKWRELDLQEKPGEHADVPLASNVVISSQGVESTNDLLANIVVTREYYFGQWPVEKLRGFEDVQRGHIHIVGNNVRTAPLSPYEIETGAVPGWHRLRSREELAVTPVITLYYSDAYGD